MHGLKQRLVKLLHGTLRIEFIEVLVLVFESALQQEILEKLKGNAAKKVPAPLPHAAVEVEQPLAHLISHMLTGVTSPIAIAYGRKPHR